MSRLIAGKRNLSLKRRKHLRTDLFLLCHRVDLHPYRTLCVRRINRYPQSMAGRGKMTAQDQAGPRRPAFLHEPLYRIQVNTLASKLRILWPGRNLFQGQSRRGNFGSRSRFASFGASRRNRQSSRRLLRGSRDDRKRPIPNHTTRQGQRQHKEDKKPAIIILLVMALVPQA